MGRELSEQISDFWLPLDQAIAPLPALELELCVSCIAYGDTAGRD